MVEIKKEDEILYSLYNKVPPERLKKPKLPLESKSQLINNLFKKYVVNNLSRL